MKLENLELLHRNMKAQDLTKTAFDFQFRDLNFAVIYLAEVFPHELLIGCRAHNLFLVVEVSEAFEISTYLGYHYAELARALGLRYDPENPFKSSVFFEALRQAIPPTTTPANTPSMTDIARHSRDVEDADKVYFLGWINHDGKQSKPSQENLAKTKRICGQEAYEICLRYHISSRWTDEADRAVAYHAPRVKP